MPVEGASAGPPAPYTDGMGDGPHPDRIGHWDGVYSTTPATAVSWYQAEPTVSLELLDAVGTTSETGVVDVGGGASVLVDRLLDRGVTDLTVLDIAEPALAVARARVGADAPVVWQVADVLTWAPARTYDRWHDRAVLHFLSGDEVAAYRAVLERAVAPDGAVVLATFAPDGPEYCSGLPVTRYDDQGLAAVLGGGFEVVARRREVHPTPSGGDQPFIWLAARRVPI